MSKSGWLVLNISVLPRAEPLLPYNKTAYANVNVSPMTGTTVYNRLGDWFPAVCVVIILGNILLTFKGKLSLVEIPGRLLTNQKIN